MDKTVFPVFKGLKDLLARKDPQARTALGTQAKLAGRVQLPPSQDPKAIPARKASPVSQAPFKGLAETQAGLVRPELQEPQEHPALSQVPRALAASPATRAPEASLATRALGASPDGQVLLPQFRVREVTRVLQERMVLATQALAAS